MPELLNGILEERGANYGDFTKQAELSQQLKECMFKAIITGGKDFKPYMFEVIEMVCMKMSRIGTGDPFHEDSWRDIAGYTTLAADRVAYENNLRVELASMLENAPESTGAPEERPDVHQHHHSPENKREKAGENGEECGDIHG